MRDPKLLELVLEYQKNRCAYCGGEFVAKRSRSPGYKRRLSVVLIKKNKGDPNNPNNREAVHLICQGYKGNDV